MLAILHAAQIVQIPVALPITPIMCQLHVARINVILEMRIAVELMLAVLVR